MDIPNLEKLDLIITRALDNVIANAKNGTAYSHWSNNPALSDLYDSDGTPSKKRADFPVYSKKSVGKYNSNNSDSTAKDYQTLLALHTKGDQQGSSYQINRPSTNMERRNSPEIKPNQPELNTQISDNRSVWRNGKWPHQANSHEKQTPANEKMEINWNNHPGHKDAYGSFTLEFISKNKGEINKRAEETGISPIALAMVIGDELQTRRDTLLKFHGAFDNGQDKKANNEIRSDTSDIGPGNFRIGTAKKIRDQKGWKIGDMELQRYLLSDEGTIHFAAMALKEAEDVMEPYLERESMPDYVYNQHLVEGYRQGPENRMNKRFTEKKEANRKWEILSAPGAQQHIYQKDLLNAYEAGESTRNHIQGNVNSYNPLLKEETFKKNLQAAQKEVERFEKPMQTGVSKNRSQFRHQQIKWILEGDDNKEYKDDLFISKDHYPYIPIENK